MLSLTSPLFPLRLGKAAEKESYIKKHGYPPEWAKETTQTMKKDWGKNFGLYLGICLPSTCPEEDLTHIISAYTKPLQLQTSLSDCQINEPRKWRASEKIAIFSMMCLLTIILIGTALDIFERNMNEKSSLCSNEGVKKEALKSFSLISNFEVLVKDDMTDNSLDFIHGMKFFTVIWMLFLHMFAYEALWNVMTLRNLAAFGKLQAPYTIMLENGTPNSSYFIFMSGFLLTYSLKNKQLNKKDYKKKNGLLKLILIKYLRIVPSVIFLMLMSFVIPATFNGPVWNSTWDDVQNKCLMNGWTNLLFVSNFLRYNDHCWVHLWVLSGLMQFHIICLPLLFIAKRRPKLAIALGSLISIGCGVRDFLVSIENEFNFSIMYSFGSIENFHDYTTKIYLKPYNHFATFGIGLIFGWINLKSFKMNKLSLAISWCFYIVFSLALYYVGRFQTENLILTAFHNAFKGIFFSLQIGWVVYTCLNGTAGIIGKIFSWKALIPFGKLLNSVSIYHPVLIVTFEAMKRERFYSTTVNYLSHTFALIFYSFLFGVIAFLMVDSPFSRLCDLWEGKSSLSNQNNLNVCSETNSTDPHSNDIISKSKDKKV